MLSQHQLVLEGRIADLDSVYESRIGVDDGEITEIAPDARGKKILHLENELIFPGFIDTHVHLRIPGEEHKEDFHTGSLAAIRGGVTLVMDMPNTKPPVTTEEIVRQKRNRANKEGLVDIRLYGLVLQENLDSLESLAPYVIAYKIFLARSTGGVMLPMEYLQIALSRIRGVNKPVTLHCESQRMIDENTERYKHSTEPDAHCDIRSLEAEIVSIQEALEQIQAFDKVNIAHLSTAEGLRTVKEYKDRGYQLACEATPHHLLLTRQSMRELGNYARMNPPLREERDKLALIEGLRSGSIDFLATDHAPHTREEKEGPNPPSGVPGLDTYGDVVAYLMREHGFTPQQIMKITSYNAAEFFGLGDRRIAVGNRANITVLDLSQPEKVEQNRLHTKCGWSPFEGMTFTGRAIYTIVNGDVYDSQAL